MKVKVRVSVKPRRLEKKKMVEKAVHLRGFGLDNKQLLCHVISSIVVITLLLVFISCANKMLQNKLIWEGHTRRYKLPDSQLPLESKRELRVAKAQNYIGEGTLHIRVG